MKHLMPVLEGGYPLDDVSIAYLQSMFDERDSFIYAAYGNKTIVSGMVLDTNNNIVSDGLLTYNGKLYHFVGGVPQEKITLKETVKQRQFEDDNLKDAFKTEFFEFGTDGTNVFSFNDLTRVSDLSIITKTLIFATNTEILEDDLEKLFTLKTLLSRTASETKKALVKAASSFDVRQKVSSNVFLSPKSLQYFDPILLTGEVTNTGGKVSYFKRDFTSSRLWEGTYKIIHNLGHTNYGLVGAAINGGTITAAMANRYANYCVMQLSDDDSPNDASFSFQIFRTS